MHFKSSTNRSPRQSTPGEPGESATQAGAEAADVGLLGFPTGKSTLIRGFGGDAEGGRLPFTTLYPNLGGEAWSRTAAS
jgi:GTP-binding protein